MKPTLAFLVGAALLAGACASGTDFSAETALDYCISQTERSLGQLAPYDFEQSPRNIAPGDSVWHQRPVSQELWTEGFWPGILWYAYEYSSDERILEAAKGYTEALGFLGSLPAYDHDLGFIIFCSYGNAYRLTGNPQYRQVILDTAERLAELYNPAVGTMLSWPREVPTFGGHNTIMDNMINLETLFWAAENGGRHELRDIAISHADTTMKYHFREDGTSYHVAVYDPESGDFIRGCTHQGYSDDSMWARGQSWAIYGYTVCYRYTGDRKYLDFACKVTDAYLKDLPEDMVPYWDFDDPSIPDAPRDASAAAVVASALLELSQYVDGTKAGEYRDKAERMLQSLYDNYRSGERNPSFLLHSTGHHPAGSEIDYSIIYADYYFIEALMRLRNLSGTSSERNRLVVYPAPEGVEMKDDFRVEVRVPGDEWQQVPTYMVKVDEVRDTRHCVEKASLGYFDFEGKVEVRVTSLKGKADSVRVRPLSYGIEAELDGNTLSFDLDRPRNLSIEVNGDIFHNLHLFANPIDRTVSPETVCGDVIEFGPGVHTIPGDTLRVNSGQTVHIAGGAVVFGTIAAIDVENVRIVGRGRVHPEGRGAGVVIKRSRNVEVEGIISTQVPTGESDGVVIRNVKVISSYGWGDGLNVFASRNVLMDGCFCRNSDDCTTVYATRLGHRGGSSDITMQNSTLWADVAHPIMIGLHGDIDRNEVIENLVYRNIDILDHKEKQIDYQGCMAINCGDNILVRNVLFEDIRVEDFRQGQLFHLKVCFNDKYCSAPGRGIDNVTFRNVSYNGSNAEHSVICGYSPERRVSNVRFENLLINGEQIWDEMPGKPKWYKTADMARIFVGPNADIPVFVQ